jgi:hypothetical protein
MRRILFLLLALLVVALVAGFFALGAFPPAHPPAPVERVLPNAQFK